MTERLTTGWTTDQVEVMQRLRDWGDTFTELNQHLAAWMGLPTSDANALGHITWSAEAGHALAPAQLSRRIGMTSGATSVLLGRLEAAGLIVRERSRTDLRRVSLHPTDATRDRTRAFLGFAGTEVAAALRAAGPEELRHVLAFLDRMTEANRQANARLARDGHPTSEARRR